jgi:hypothetical protein
MYDKERENEMKKWQSYLDKGTPDNEDIENICTANSLPDLFRVIMRAITPEQLTSLQNSECTLNVWYGDKETK